MAVYLREPQQKKFIYKNSKTLKKLKDKTTLSWINSLVIPPAWTDVRIYSQKSRKIHAWGRDSKNKKQYIYNASWRAKREKEKFNKIISFASKLPKMRTETSKHLKLKHLCKDKVLACMVRLLDNAYFRPGNKYYSEENSTYGLTTLRSKHLDISDGVMEFNYVGKSGKSQHKVVDDATLAKIVDQLDNLPGYEIFQYYNNDEQRISVSPDMLNDYIQTVMGGKYTAKDFRTWAGTYLASVLLSEMGFSKCKKNQKKNIVKAVDKVAEVLGNTRSVAKANYIDPRVVKHYKKGNTIENYVKEFKSELLSKEMISPQEKALMKLLKEKL